MLVPWKKSYEQPRQHIYKQKHCFAEKVCLVKADFSSSHVWMWELDHKENCAPKKWWFWTVVLEKIFESPLDCKEIQPAHPKVNWSWIFIRRTDAEGETPVLWPTDTKNWLIGKDPDAGKNWRQEEKETTKDEILDGISNSMNMRLSKLQEMVKDREACCAAIRGVSKSCTQVSDWIKINPSIN